MNPVLLGLISLYKFFRKSWLKLSGKTEEDIVNQEFVNGEAWESFCENLKTAGAALMYSGAPRDAFQQAEGVRYLSRLTRAALEAFVEYNDPHFPVFKRMVHETVKMGADNPDNYYLNAQVDGSLEYRIRGKRNTIYYFGIFSQNGSYGSTGGLAPCGVLEDDQLILEDDGSFEIMASRKQKGKNWLKIEPETTLLMVRQTFFHRYSEEPVELTIECLDRPDTPNPLDPKKLKDSLETAELFVAGAPMLFSKWAKGFRKHTNQLPMFDPGVSNAAGGDSRIIYYHSHWELEKDQVLVIEFTPPECDTWNFQLNNYWMESLDYRYFNICISKGTATFEENGLVRICVAHTDPGIPNWIMTAGHLEGTMCLRWYRPTTTDLPVPVTVVKSLDSVLGDG